MKKVFFFALIGLLTVSEVSAQPASVLTFLGGYSIAMGDMKGKFGSTWDTYQTNPDSNTYFLQNGMNFGMDMKFAPYKDTKLKIIGGVHFASFSQGAQYSN